MKSLVWKCFKYFRATVSTNDALMKDNFLDETKEQVKLP